jgi:hypothetical protein
MNSFINIDIESQAETSNLKAFKKVYHVEKQDQVKKWFWGFLLLLVEF